MNIVSKYEQKKNNEKEFNKSIKKDENKRNEMIKKIELGQFSLRKSENIDSSDQFSFIKFDL